MSNLLITLISIVLFTLFLFAGSNYISVDSVSYYRDNVKITHALNSYRTSVFSYYSLNDTYPNSIADISYDYAHNKMPEFPQYISYESFGTNPSTGVVELCLYANIVDGEKLETINKISKDSGYMNFIYSDKCGSTVNDYPDEFPASGYITYFIR